MLGSVTPSSLTRRSIVWRAWTTASSRSVDLDVRLHREGVGAVRRRELAIEVGLRPRRPPAGTPRPASGGTPSTLNCDRARPASMFADRDVRASCSVFAQPLHLRLGLEPQRIVGLHAQHEVHAALQVEPELELLVHQPAGRRACRSARRQSDRRRRAEEDDEDGEDGDELPAQVGHDAFSTDSAGSTTGACP